MIGKLFFVRQFGETGSCTACVIQNRLVVTAAHCLYKDGVFHTNIHFVPAFRNGTAPYGAWRYQKIWVTRRWADSSSVPSLSDYGIVSLADMPVDLAGDEVVASVGQLLGWMGVKTYALLNNQATTVGYPTNFNSGLIMHEVSSQYRRTRSEVGTIEYPNDMTEGISGGPWVADIGDPTIGAIIGISSYRDKDEDRKYLGSAILDTDFMDLFKEACKTSGNCIQ